MSFMLNPEAYSILESSILLQINEGAGAWIKQVTGNIFEYSDPVKLSFNIASVPKQLRVESNLILNEDDVSRAHNICRGWQPEKWSLIEAVRILFNLTVIHKTDNAEDILFQIYQLTELNEQAAFLKGIPLYGKTEFFLNCSREAVRSNIRPLFEAIALFNPFPADNFSENEWNNMILKAISWNYQLQDIYGVATRDNIELAAMLYEYAKEQIGSKRPVSGNLWDYFSIYASENELPDLAALMKQLGDH
ncbi:hypothetical protein ABO04_07755 [Nitrosomonas sp. HPC101]|nr:hypothetical protein [Nitrosomonas sp. HPC101]